MIFVSFVFALAVFMIVGAAAEVISAVVGMVTRVAATPSATAAMTSGVRIEVDNEKIGAKAACFCDFIVTFAPNVGGAGPLSVAALPCSHAASASDHEDSNVMNQKIYNLEDFATQYHLSDIFGAYAAHLAVTAGEGATLVDMMAERTLFTKLLLVERGSCRLVDADGEGQGAVLSRASLLVVSVRDTAQLCDVSPDFEAECVLVDESFAPHASHYRLTDEKYKSMQDIFHFMRDIVRHQHINKIEMIQSMVNVLRLIIDELPYTQRSISHDLGHKKAVYEVFLHHLYRNFRKERQIRFYADKLNLSAPYLSRLVKEISGSTINDHVTSLLYKEICNMLTQTDMTMGEIADHLNFSDQSALTNFFKQRSGMTPIAYRNR